jgi:hypothetical protein
VVITSSCTSPGTVNAVHTKKTRNVSTLLQRRERADGCV